MLSAGIWQWVSACLQSAIRDRRAVTAVEYALIAGIIAIAIVGGVTKIGNEVGASFNRVSTGL